MPKFSEISEERLATADPRLQRLFNEVIKTHDCVILCGHRGQAAQDAAVATGKSKTPWPTSKHNAQPALAVDAAPMPLDWTDTQAFYDFASHVHAVAGTLGIPIRWGGLFKFRDYDHFEICEGRP